MCSEKKKTLRRNSAAEDIWGLGAIFTNLANKLNFSFTKKIYFSVKLKIIFAKQNFANKNLKEKVIYTAVSGKRVSGCVAYCSVHINLY